MARVWAQAQVQEAALVQEALEAQDQKEMAFLVILAVGRWYMMVWELMTAWASREEGMHRIRKAGKSC